jgi:hypothetical protein
MKDELITFTVRNANLYYKKGYPMTLDLIEPAMHGDWKDTTRELVPIGKYDVVDVWLNCYGWQVRINYHGRQHDIEPRHFEWHKEDQHQTSLGDGLQKEKDTIGKYEVVTLCGSTRFKDQFIEQQKRLTLEGKLVISVGLFGHSGDDITDEQKVMLDDMHKRKIDMADSIFVINVNGYIGSSTRSEIDYATSIGRLVNYLETPNKLL